MLSPAGLGGEEIYLPRVGSGSERYSVATVAVFAADLHLHPNLFRWESKVNGPWACLVTDLLPAPRPQNSLLKYRELLHGMPLVNMPPC